MLTANVHELAKWKLRNLYSCLTLKRSKLIEEQVVLKLSKGKIKLFVSLSYKA